MAATRAIALSCGKRSLKIIACVVRPRYAPNRPKDDDKPDRSGKTLPPAGIAAAWFPPCLDYRNMNDELASLRIRQVGCERRGPRARTPRVIPRVPEENVPDATLPTNTAAAPAFVAANPSGIYRLHLVLDQEVRPRRPLPTSIPLVPNTPSPIPLQEWTT